jgi:hypothetical protein
MYKICSHEYRQFFEEYNKFLHHYEKAVLFWVIIETSKSKNVQVGLLYERAVEEHIAATNAYTNFVGWDWYPPKYRHSLSHTRDAITDVCQ